MLKAIIVTLMVLPLAGTAFVAIACCKTAGLCSRDEEKQTDQKFERG